MKARVSAADSGMQEIEVKVELSMKVREWRLLVGQMDKNNHPSWEVRDVLHEAVQKVLRSVESVVSGEEVKS